MSTAKDRETFLKGVVRQMRLLLHTPGDFERDAQGRYTVRCAKCGVVVRLKIALKVHDLDLSKECEGKP